MFTGIVEGVGKVISLDELPEFIKVNWKKYEEFLDLRP